MSLLVLSKVYCYDIVVYLPIAAEAYRAIYYIDAASEWLVKVFLLKYTSKIMFWYHFCSVKIIFTCLHKKTIRSGSWYSSWCDVGASPRQTQPVKWLQARGKSVKTCVPCPLGDDGLIDTVSKQQHNEIWLLEGSRARVRTHTRTLRVRELSESIKLGLLYRVSLSLQMQIERIYISLIHSRYQALSVSTLSQYWVGTGSSRFLRIYAVTYSPC